MDFVIVPDPNMCTPMASKWSSSALLMTSAFHEVGAYGSTTKISTADLTVMPSISLTKPGSYTASHSGGKPPPAYSKNNDPCLLQ